MNTSIKSTARLFVLGLIPLAAACSGEGTTGAAGSSTSSGATGIGGSSGLAAAGGASGGIVGSSAAAGGDTSGTAVSSGASAAAGDIPGMSGVGGSGATSGSDPGAISDGGADATIDVGPVTGDAGVVDPSKKITVWLAGDSTMQPCTTTCPCGWGSQFQPYFTSNATVVDNGAGGRSIQTWLYEPNVSTTMVKGECAVNPKTYSARWQAMLDPPNGMKQGDYLFIEFGINDSAGTCNRHVGAALFQTYLGTMAQAAKARGAHPIFLTSTSFMQCTGSTVTPNRGFGPETKAAGVANNVTVIDLTQRSAALYTSLGLCPNDGNYASTTSAVGKFFCNDHTHFEAAGAAKIAGAVAQALRDQNIGLAAYLK